MIWILYLVMSTPAGIEHWDPGVDYFKTLEECEVERDKILEEVTFELSGHVLKDVICLDEVVGYE